MLPDHADDIATAYDLGAPEARLEVVAIAVGVTAPRPLRTLSGQVLTDVGQHHVRCYEWVDSKCRSGRSPARS